MSTKAYYPISEIGAGKPGFAKKHVQLLKLLFMATM